MTIKTKELKYQPWEFVAVDVVIQNADDKATSEPVTVGLVHRSSKENLNEWLKRHITIPKTANVFVYPYYVTLH